MRSVLRYDAPLVAPPDGYDGNFFEGKLSIIDMETTLRVAIHMSGCGQNSMRHNHFHSFLLESRGFIRSIATKLTEKKKKIL